MVLLAFAVGAAIIIVTIAFTASRYRELPDRIPLHFGITGIADSYGPRPFIWLVVGMQLLCAAVYTVLYLSAGDRATLKFKSFPPRSRERTEFRLRYSGQSS